MGGRPLSSTNTLLRSEVGHTFSMTTWGIVELKALLTTRWGVNEVMPKRSLHLLPLVCFSHTSRGSCIPSKQSIVDPLSE